MVADRSERLPWLQEVPRMAPPTPPSPRRRKSRRLAVPLAGVALLLAGIGGGAYWAGTLDGPNAVAEDPTASSVDLDNPVYEPAPDPMTPAAPIPALPVAEAPPPPVEQTIVEPPEQITPVVTQVPAPVVVPDAPAPQLSSRVRERLKKVRAEAKQEETVQPVKLAARTVKPKPKPKPRPFQLVPPGPRGRIVQLGSFTAVPDAQQNWRGIAKRWPYLLTKPRILTPIWMPQQKSWRLIYRLQLGTASQAQSAVICQRLQKAGQPCVVVY